MAFKNLHNQLSELIIPHSVTKLGWGVLYGTNLNELIIPNSVTSIDSNPFYNARITSIIFEDGDTPISMGDGGNQVAGGYFSSCECDSFYVGRIFKYSKYSPFQCASKIKSITLGPLITTIPEWTFYACSSLQSFTIPATVSSIGMGAFKYCSALNALKFEDSEEKIEIEEEVFSTLENIESLYLGRDFDCQSISLLGKGSNRLRDLSIGKFVKSAAHIFSYNSYIYDANLSSIKCYADNPPALDRLSEDRYISIVPVIPPGTTTAYENAAVWKNFWSFSEEDMSSITPINVDESHTNVTYYLINGMRVREEPTHGIYIRKQGNKVMKVVK